MIPIFIDHDTSKQPIGTFDNGIVVLNKSISQSYLYETFGNIGYRVLNYNSVLTQFEIMAWSLPTQLSENQLRCDAYVLQILNDLSAGKQDVQTTMQKLIPLLMKFR